LKEKASIDDSAFEALEKDFQEVDIALVDELHQPLNMKESLENVCAL
jgi:hypothetical protein